MRVKAITMSKEKAKKEWKAYLALLKKRKEKYLKEFKDAYYHLSKGRKIIDICEVMKGAGINEKFEPRLAIAPANEKTIYFHKREGGVGRFSTKWRSWGNRFDVSLPKETFPEWPKEKGHEYTIDKETLETSVPKIPANYVPDGELSNYYLLWEVEYWKLPPKDPILLKRVSKNLFAVLAGWQLTKLERAIIGRVA